MKKLLNNKKGFALIATILSLAVISILGLTIISTTTSNFKMVQIDSRSQSAYYIAEAGVNYAIDDINKKAEVFYTEALDNNKNVKENYKDKVRTDFLNSLYDYVNGKYKNNFVLASFEENRGDKPKANIKVNLKETLEETREFKDIYNIESKGTIGKSSRTATSTISLGEYQNVEEEHNYSNILFDTDKFAFKGKNFNADGTIVIGESGTNDSKGNTNINAKNIYFRKTESKKTESRKILGNIYGDKNNPGLIYFGESATISLKELYGNVYVDGDLTVLGNTTVIGDVYITGKIVGNLKVNGKSHIGYKSMLPIIPKCTISLKNDKWYEDNEYTARANVNSNTVTKLFVENYDDTINEDINGRIIIVSKGDITLKRNGNGKKALEGALIAPNGKVKYHGKEFKGVVISNKEIDIDVTGNEQLDAQSLEEFFRELNMPIPVNHTCNNLNSNNGNSNNTNNSPKANEFTFSPIKEVNNRENLK